MSSELVLMGLTRCSRGPSCIERGAVRYRASRVPSYPLALVILAAVNNGLPRFSGRLPGDCVLDGGCRLINAVATRPRHPARGVCTRMETPVQSATQPPAISNGPQA